MTVARVYAAQPAVLSGTIITVEADLSRGLHSFTIVGLAGKAVEEAKDRVNSAIKNSGYDAPKSQNHKITISLAPADIKKEGPLFDLPIAVAYLLAAELVRTDDTKRIYVGELALDGTLQPIKGVLPIVQTAKEQGYEEVIVPTMNAEEAALIRGINIKPAKTLTEVVQHITTETEVHTALPTQAASSITEVWGEGKVSLEDIRGQETAKRGLIIAAAGRHNILLVGPPGTGKTMLARALEGLLPPLEISEALEVTAIHSVAGELGNAITTRPPFRAPHHTASHTSLVGGGTHPRPGEVTLAHRGVLFLDEFPEFERRSIDALRQPLEDRVVSISRVQSSAIFPADFILVAAMNPTRGGDEAGEYSDQMLQTYKHKISGPILDRIDLWLPVPHVPFDTLTSENTQTDETEPARAAIHAARALQHHRLAGSGVLTNAEMTARDIDARIELTAEVRTLLKNSAERLNLSPRSYHRVIKVARTIADLDEKNVIETNHVLEALQYRVQL